MKRLFALLVAVVMTAGVLSVYAEEAPSAPDQGTDYTQPKTVKKAKKIKKHHKQKQHRKNVRKQKVSETETSVPAEPAVQ